MTTATTRTYAVHAIDAATLAELRDHDDAGRRPPLATDAAGSPLRCCLRPARPGEPVLLASYAPVRRWAAARGVDPGAYDEVGPVFIHAAPCAGPAGDGYPHEVGAGPRVFRGYDMAGRIVTGVLASAGEDPERVLETVLADDRVAVVHARALGFGCFTFAVTPLGAAAQVSGPA